MVDRRANKLGAWAFVIGLVLAVIVAIISGANPPAWAVFIIALIGIIVGLVNIADTETQNFLIASIAFLLSFQALAAITRTIALGWEAVSTFFGLMAIFVAPAAAIVAVKALYNLARD